MSHNKSNYDKLDMYGKLDMQVLSASRHNLDCLLYCFDIILKGKQLRLDIKILHIIMNDLDISMKNFSPSMKCILCECLCYYMQLWPGWKMNRSLFLDTKVKENYQAEFREYLILKLKYIIENKAMFNIDNANTQINSIQVDKLEAPYSLVISGQPYFINNLGFIESKNHIIIQPHIGRPWKSLSITQFLNYPFVQVSMKLPDLELTRRNSHSFTRYISNYEDGIDCLQTSFIDSVKQNDVEEQVHVYTIDFISDYCKQFIELLKKQHGMQKCKIIELEMIIKQFLWDVKESNVEQCLLSSGRLVNTMATNVSVCFNIGGHTYIRNKKMSITSDHINKEHANAINFKEILTPKVTFTLNKFIAEEDETYSTSFKSLNELSSKVGHNYQESSSFTELIQNCVTYSCLLCSITYAGKESYNKICQHFKVDHKGEQTILCYKCRKEFDIAHLAGSRWAHNCKEQNENIENSIPLNVNADSLSCSNIDVVAQQS